MAKALITRASRCTLEFRLVARDEGCKADDQSIRKAPPHIHVERKEVHRELCGNFSAAAFFDRFLLE